MQTDRSEFGLKVFLKVTDIFQLQRASLIPNMINALRRTINTSLNPFAVVLFLFGSFLGVSPCALANPPLANDTLGIVRLRDGTVFKGNFAPKASEADGAVFTWACPTFEEQLSIPWEQIDSISLPASHSLPSSKGVASGLSNGSSSQESSTAPDSPTSDSPATSNLETDAALASHQPVFTFEFWNGGTLTGHIASINSETVEVESARFPRQTFKLPNIRTILRVQEKDATDIGEIPLESWKQSIPPLSQDQTPVWELQADSLKTTTAGAQITTPLLIPDVCSIEIDTAWNHSSPNWILSIGQPRQLQLHLRKIEHRNVLAITLLFEESQNADIATAIVPFEGLESIKLRVLADYIRGRFALELAGKNIAEIRGKEKKRSGGVQPVQFTNNTTGGIYLRDLRISRSVFSIEDLASEQKSQLGTPPKIILENTEEYVGFPDDFKESDGSFGFADSAKVLGRIALDSIERIEFHAESEEILEGLKDSAKDSIYYVIELSDGGRFSSERLAIEEDAVVLTDSVAQEPIRCAFHEVTAIRIKNADIATPETQSKDSPPVMRLVTPHVISKGTLASKSSENSDVGAMSQGLFWKSQSLTKSTALAKSLDGTIDVLTPADPSNTKEPSRSNTNTSRGRPNSTGIPLGSLEPSGRLLQPGEPSLYLVDGDAIPSTVTSIDNGIVKGISDYFGEFEISSDDVQGFRLLVYSGTQKIDAKVMNRLLMVPRLQRAEPPTHLIVSREGDVVRGKLLRYIPDAITLYLHGQEHTIDTKNIAEIARLIPPDPVDADPIDIDPKDGDDIDHNNKIDDTNGTNSHEGSKKPTDSPEDIHVVMTHGTSVRIRPDKVLDNQILGIHDSLGRCVLPFQDCKRILFGNKIDEGLQSSAFTKWKLRHAIDPRFVQREREASMVASGKSKWIGKTLPEVELNILDSQPIQTGHLKDRVSVICYWNSGSEACLEWLPALANSVRDFGADEVQFIALNGLETVQVVRAASAGMDLVNILPTIQLGLDRDGAAGKAFEVLTMPYTIVLDRNGRVSHVQMGYDENSTDRIRNAVAAALDTALDVTSPNR